MTESLRTWVFGTLGVAALSWAALLLVPKGSVREVTKLLCGVVLVTVLISPVKDFDFSAYSANLAKYRAEAALIEGKQRDENDRISALIIEDECSAYILDKAQELGLRINSAQVSVKRGDDSSWYPYEAKLDINGEAQSQKSLQDAIESELGIPRERQYWSNENED